jgi:hypothetical protein
MSSRNCDLLDGNAVLMDGEHPSEVAHEARKVLMGEALHHHLPRPRVLDGVGDKGIPKKGIEEGCFSDLFHVYIVPSVWVNVKRKRGKLRMPV